MKKSFFDEVLSGVSSTLSALGYISRNGMMWVYGLIFLLIVLVSFGGWSVSSWLGDWVEGIVGGLFNVESYGEDSWLSYVASALSTVSWFLAKVISVILFCFIIGYLLLIILSPVFSYMAEKTIKVETGHEVPFALGTLLWGIVRGIGISLKNLFFQLLLTVVLLIIGLIPGVGIFTTIAIFIINAYFLGCAVSDYAMEALKLSISQSSSFSRQHKGQMMGVGLVYALSAFVPFLGIYIALLVAPLCVVGGSLQMAGHVKTGELVLPQ